MNSDTDMLKKAAADAIDAECEAVFRLSRDINSKPEIAWEEFFASSSVSDFLEERQFRLTRSFCGIETSFLAEFGSRGAVFPAIIAEYDALPDVGHGCGHNLIAAAAAAAGAGVAAALGGKRAPAGAGFCVLGTPAEEVVDGVSGKTLMLEKGAFSGISHALMFHPWTCTGVARKDLGYTVYRIAFTGPPSACRRRSLERQERARCRCCLL